jgi:branched-chain amino acid transport system substrate-binding protein
VLGGAASNFQFLKENTEAAQYIMDCNHWYDARKAGAQELRKKAEARNLAFTYELFLNYSCVGLLADALERAKSADRAAIIQALASSTWDGHIMPYGPTRFVNGQNTGARAMNTQILAEDIKVVYPPEYATAPVVFPRPRA